MIRGVGSPIELGERSNERVYAMYIYWHNKTTEAVTSKLTEIAEEGPTRNFNINGKFFEVSNFEFREILFNYIE